MLAWLVRAILVLLLGLSLAGLAALISGLALSELWLELLGLGLSALALPCLLSLAWIRLPAPEGYIVPPHKAPKLFETIEKVRRKASSTKFDEVRLTENFELRLQLRPRLGLLGWNKKILLIGLPLLQLFSRREVAALIARQFEHLDGYLDPRGAGLYRLNQTWPGLRARLEARKHPLLRLGLFPLRGLLECIEAESRLFLLDHEFEADELGALIVGPRIMADALIASHLAQSFLDEAFWPQFWSRAETSPSPIAPYGTMHSALLALASLEQKDRWLRSALEYAPQGDERQPSLHERLRALGQTPEQPPQSTYSAANVLLGEAFQAILKDFDSHWLKIHARDWQAHRSNMQYAREQIRIFSRSAPETLKACELHRYGLALLKLGSLHEALRILGLAAENSGGSAQAALDAARHHLASGHKVGIRYLELAVRRDPALDIHADELLKAFRERQLARTYTSILPSAA